MSQLVKKVVLIYIDDIEVRIFKIIEGFFLNKYLNGVSDFCFFISYCIVIFQWLFSNFGYLGIEEVIEFLRDLVFYFIVIVLLKF